MFGFWGSPPSPYARCDAQFGEDRDGIVRGRAAGPVDAVKVAPQRIEFGQWMALRQLHDDATASAARERGDEGVTRPTG